MNNEAIAKSGEKFVLEIEDVMTGQKGESLYKVKGFRTLIFDDYGIMKLTPYKEPTSAEEAWNFAADLYRGRELESLTDVYGMAVGEESVFPGHVIERLTYEEARRLMNEYKANHTNDEVILERGSVVEWHGENYCLLDTRGAFDVNGLCINSGAVLQSGDGEILVGVPKEELKPVRG